MRGDHPRRDVPRVRAGESDPRESVDRLQTLEQRREVAGRVVGRLIVIDDLPEQLDFARAGVDGMARLGDDVRRRPHALVTARVRHDAERAEFVAAFDDGDVGLDRIEAASDPQRKRDIAHRIDIEDRRGPSFPAD